MLRREKGIILNSRKLKESDCMVKFFMQKGEMETLKIHGIRATKTRNILISEPGSIVEFVFYTGKNSQQGSVKEGTLLERFDPIKSSYGSMLLLSAFLELAGNAAQDESAEDIYDLLFRALQYLNEKLKLAKFQNESFMLLFIFFIMRLFDLLGMKGSSEVCPSCGLPSEGIVFWNKPHLEFLCGNCDARASDEDRKFLHCMDAACRQKYEKFASLAENFQRKDPDFIKNFLIASGFCLSSLDAKLPACSEFLKQHNSLQN